MHPYRRSPCNLEPLRAFAIVDDENVTVGEGAGPHGPKRVISGKLEDAGQRAPGGKEK